MKYKCQNCLGTAEAKAKLKGMIKDRKFAITDKCKVCSRWKVTEHK